MDKITSMQGGQPNKMSFRQKICPKNHTHAPNVQNRPRFNIFWFLILILYIIYIGKQQVLFITQEQLGNFYSAISTFKCWGSTAAVFVCEYLFTLVKAKDDQMVLKNCHVKNISQLGFFCIIILTITVQHGKVYFNFH